MTEEQAKQRFMILNLVRLVALMIVVAGVANLGGALLPDLSPMLGYVLLIAGALDFFLVPVILKNAWRRQEP